MSYNESQHEPTLKMVITRAVPNRESLHEERYSKDVHLWIGLKKDSHVIGSGRLGAKARQDDWLVE